MLYILETIPNNMFVPIFFFIFNLEKFYSGFIDAVKQEIIPPLDTDINKIINNKCHHNKST